MKNNSVPYRSNSLSVTDVNLIVVLVFTNMTLPYFSWGRSIIADMLQILGCILLRLR